MTSNASAFSFGDFHFSFVNNQIVSVKIGTAPTRTLKHPTTIPLSLLSRFAPSQMAPTRDSKLSIQVRESVDTNYRFTPSEKNQLLALLATMPTQESQGLKLIQSQPLSARPKDLPSGQVCDLQGPEQAATLSCYFDTLAARQAAEIDMNHQLLQLMGGRYFDSDLLMGSGDRQEWGALWDHGGKDRQDYQNWYENFMADSEDLMAQAVAALNVSGAPLQVTLFVASHFFNPSNNTVSFTSRGAGNVLGAKAQPVKWSDNAIRLANYSIQVQRIDNPDDPNYGRFLIVSVQADGGSAIDLSASPVLLPDAFVGVVPQVVAGQSTRGAFYTIPKTRLVVEIRSDGTRTIARGGLEDHSLGEGKGQRVMIEAEGASPLELALSLAKSVFQMPAIARAAARALLAGGEAGKKKKGH